MEDYAAKMLLKTDAALREYVTGHAQYREAAVLAAFDELRRRGQPAPEEAALRPGLEAGAAEQATRDAAAAAERQQAEAPASADDEETGPALYSPVTIALFSILPMPMFSMIAGGILMCLNLFRVGRKRAMLGLMLFIIAYLYIGSALISWAFLHGMNIVWALMAFNIPAALVYILWFWPRYIRTTNFRSRSIFLPVLVCVIVIWGLEKISPYVMEKQPKEMRQKIEKMMPQPPQP
ncbi:hypothetical protein Q5H92_16480 [Hymenobacter sp. M29]|uniref:Uncharacterized protein n=1 Tax=Hymenobacter mellowenesis TaxID=3063995 RepID=A0ABT9ADN6_9BACT|nr:hypothetical protein [Hymenobacter sp. M29]MDO7847964.1 hypothetical protein [Hymenobacter sp. M29]